MFDRCYKYRMKNQLRFIPDTISGISNNSVNLQGLQNMSVTEYQSDSTDQLVSEILKARAERLMKLQQESQAEKEQQISIEQNFDKTVVSKDSSIPLAMPHGSGQNEVQANKSKQDKLQSVQNDLFEKRQGTFNSSEQKNYQRADKKQSSQLKKQQEKYAQSSEINATLKGKNVLERDQYENKKMNSSYRLDEQKQDSHFQLPKVDKINNQSMEQSVSNNDKSLKFVASMVPYEPASDYLELGMENSRNTNIKQESSAIQVPFVEDNEKTIPRQIQKSQESIGAAESNIKERSQASIPKIVTPEKEENAYKQTDAEVVLALTNHLNQINQIEEAENMEALSRKRMSEKSPSIKMSVKIENHHSNNREAVNIGSQFETEYSQDMRDFRILEHHFESNMHCLNGQLQELRELEKYLSLEVECIELRKAVKNAEMENRRFKIMLRSGSYSKKFNYNSPISKNNKLPLEFFKKFKVSPNYAGRFYQTIQRIEDQKKIQTELEEEYKIFCRFFELMKSKQISSYPVLPFELQYDSKLQKYTMIGSSYRAKRLKQSMGRYEFDKSKRSLDIDETQIGYLDLLKYKKDISKDAILQYEVFHLGRLKKMKDENTLIRKEIQFVEQQIREVGKEMKMPAEEPCLVKSQYYTKSKTFFSRSPISKTRTVKMLSNYISPMKRVSQTNREMRSAKKLQLSQNKQSSQKRLKLQSSKEPQSVKKVMSPLGKMKKTEVIAQMEDDYGLSELKKNRKQGQDIPTFGKKQSQRMIIACNQSQKVNEAKSSSSKKKNFIAINKKLSSRTEVRLGAKGSQDFLRRLDSQKMSPLKKNTFTQPSISVEQSNGNEGNFV